MLGSLISTPSSLPETFDFKVISLTFKTIVFLRCCIFKSEKNDCGDSPQLRIYLCHFAPNNSNYSNTSTNMYAIYNSGDIYNGSNSNKTGLFTNAVGCILYNPGTIHNYSLSQNAFTNSGSISNNNNSAINFKVKQGKIRFDLTNRSVRTLVDVRIKELCHNCCRYIYTFTLQVLLKLDIIIIIIIILSLLIGFFKIMSRCSHD